MGHLYAGGAAALETFDPRQSRCLAPAAAVAIVTTACSAEDVALPPGGPHHAALASCFRVHWYEIDSALGQGGFGITYLVTDTNPHNPVSIKEFRPPISPCEPMVNGHDSTGACGGVDPSTPRAAPAKH